VAVRLDGRAQARGVGGQRAAESTRRRTCHSITQKPLRRALTAATVRRRHAREYKQRRDQVLAWSKRAALRCAVPRGRVLLFPDISDFLSPDRVRTSLDFADGLLKEHLS
jgi:hypothetical protein